MQKVERYIVYGTLIVLFVLAAIFDFTITKGLYEPNNGFGKTFEVIAVFPPYWLGVFGLSLISRFHPSKGKGSDRFLFVFFLILAIGLSLYGGYHAAKLLCRTLCFVPSTGIQLLIGLGLSALIYPLSTFFAYRVNKGYSRNAFHLGVFVVAVLACSVIWMEIVKLIWFRPRYRTLDALLQVGAIDDISAWWLPFYHPQLFISFKKYNVGGEYGFTSAQIEQASKILGIGKWGNDEFYSFPSGHTMNALVCLCAASLGDVFPRLRKKNAGLILRIAIYAFALTVGLSRIVRGAHNATDVLAGMIFSLAIFDLGETFLYHRFLKVYC